MRKNTLLSFLSIIFLSLLLIGQSFAEDKSSSQKNIGKFTSISNNGNVKDLQGASTAIITSTNQFLISYAQETRSYSLLFLLSILSYLFFIKVLTKYSEKNFILYLLFTIALLYTHYFAFFLVATQVFVFIYFIIQEKEKRQLLTKLAILTCITYILALLPLVEYIVNHEDKTSFWIPGVSNLFF